MPRFDHKHEDRSILATSAEANTQTAVGPSLSTTPDAAWIAQRRW